MQIGGSPGVQAMTQLMQSSSQLSHLAAQQMNVVQGDLSQAKADALQNSATQVSQAVERKGNFIDVMA